MSDQGIIDRGLGSLLGLAVGDAIGTTLEFSRRDSRPHVAGMEGGGPFRLAPGEWTDDTSMALCLADSLLERGCLDQRDLMERFVRWWKHGENSVGCRDIGVTTSAALQRFLDTDNPVAGSTDPRTAGNGSIMRLAPVALRWQGDAESALGAAREQSVTTHGAPAAIEGCALLASILLDGITSGDKSEALRDRSSSESSIDVVARGSWRTKTREEIRSSGYVVHTLEAALWAVDQSGDFRTAALSAANLGEDADTVAAVAGQIAGSIWGLSAIPPHWRLQLAWRDKIEGLGRRLLSAGMR